MREIKFRAWGRNVGTGEFEMIYSATPDRQLFQCDALSSFFEEATEHDKIMQYTGLKDKNGVEIYEGDILSQSSHTSYRFKYRGVVRYESDYGGFIAEGEYSKNQHHERLTCDVAIDCEIIGNTYQHPHLLTHSAPTSISGAPQ